MPDRSESESVVKKRQQSSKNNSFNSGYSSEGSGDSKDDYNKSTSAGSRSRRGGRRSDEGGKTSASVIWLVLTVGLMFCLMDAAYISRVIDRVPTIEDETNSLAADLILAEMRKAGLTPGGQGSRQLNRQDFSEVLKDTSIEHYAAKDMVGHSGTGSRPEHAPQRGRAPQLNFVEEGKMLAKMTRAERLAYQKKQKEEAEVKRIQNVKMAALEALKADHGGKLPADMMDSVLADEEAFKPRPIHSYLDKAFADDKQFILDLFIDAGLKEMDDSTYKVLPTWQGVKELYGVEPKIVGLEQCETFQAKGNLWDHFVSTAGTFNSGTNLMAELLIHNCHMAERMEKFGKKNRGVRWQVPWGKHVPPGDEEYRLAHKSIKDKDVDANMIIPAVTVRDPYYWMQSMCKHHYTVSWRGSNRCPNLTPLAADKANYPMLRDKDYYPVDVRYPDFHRKHKSLTGLWNDWYNEYKGVEFQHLFVRYEDLLFHPKQVTETVCRCAGGTVNTGKFQYQVDSAKKGIGAHGSVRTGYVDAIIKYGSDRSRYSGYHPEDLKYAREHLDEVMMEQFGYKYHPMSLETGSGSNGGAGENAGNEHADIPEEEGDPNRKHAEEFEPPEIPQEDAEETGDGKQWNNWW